MKYLSIFPSPEAIEIQKQMEINRINRAEAEFIALAEYHKKRIKLVSEGFIGMANVCQKNLRELKQILSEDIQ